MKTFGERVIRYYENLQPPSVPDGVEVLYPLQEHEVMRVIREFYGRYFNNTSQRTFLIGINPGRHGGGSTGIPFTDPQKLTEILRISNAFEGQQELSSRFIYQMIEYLGGPEAFYNRFYITSVSPLGFTRDGRNLNYYDEKELELALEDYIFENMKAQLAFGANPVAYSLGMGKNIAYLKQFNRKHKLFREIRPLPHPRWIMQYRLKRLDEFLDLYRNELENV